MEEQLEKKITRVLWILIMREEMDSILEKESFVLDKENSKKYENILEFFSKIIGDQEIIMVRLKKDPTHQTSVFGTELAFFAAYNAIMIYNPDLVINMGYAGDTGAEGNLPLGSVCVAQRSAKYHRREMLIEFFRKTNEGNYPLRTFDNFTNDLKYRAVSVGTSNSFVPFDEIAFKQGIALVEMEFASITRACAYFNKSVLGVKIVSDNNEARENREKAFSDSLVNLKDTIFKTFKEITNYLDNKRIIDL
jgi:nucleoside phosphorylase